MPVPILGYIYFVASLVPVSVGFVRFRSIGRPMKVLTVLCVLSLVSATAAFILGRFNINNHFISNAYMPVEVVLIMLVYFFSARVTKHRRVLVGSAVLFVAVWIIDKVLFEIPNQISSRMALVSRLLLIASSLFMISVASNDATAKLSDKAVFWIAAGVILYSAGTFIGVGLANRLLELNVTLFDIAWHINWSLLIISNLFYTKGLLCKSQQ